MNIGFIAAETKRQLLQNFCVAYRGILSKHTLYATGTSGRLIEDASGLVVQKLLSGFLGGEQQMAAMIEQNQMDLVIYLCGSFYERRHNLEEQKIMRLCDSNSIPLATNLASAELLIKSLERGELDWRENYK